MQTGHPSVLSIQVGIPRTLGLEDTENQLDAPFISGILKLSIEGPVLCGKLNLAGDAQADLVHHGGLDKAVLFYDAAHYAVWCKDLQMTHLPHGGFGENFTVAGQSENTVCVGDVYRIGSAIFEISQPRRPCWKLGRRWGRADLLRLVEENARTGWYARVLEEGIVQAGDTIDLIARPLPQFTIEYVTRVVQQWHLRVEEAKKLESCVSLSENIRSVLRKSLVLQEMHVLG